MGKNEKRHLKVISCSLLSFLLSTMKISAQVDCNTPSGVLALMSAKVIVSTDITPATTKAALDLPFKFTSELFLQPQVEAVNAVCINSISFQIYTSLSSSALSGLPNLASTNPNFTLPAGVRRTSMSKTRNGYAVYVSGSVSKTDYAEGSTVYYRLAKRITNCNTCTGVDPTVFSSTASFVVPSLGPTDIDGNKYDAVFIGTQLWMKQNLKVTKYRDGTMIGASESGRAIDYNNDPANSVKFGKLYNWHAVINTRGVCPSGWHVPNETEWNTLINFLGGNAVAGGKMKAVTTLWVAPNEGATNTSNFSALPGSLLFGVQTFSTGSTGAYFAGTIGKRGIWWSSTGGSTGNAYARYLDYDKATITITQNNKEDCMSVRCIRD